MQVIGGITGKWKQLWRGWAIPETCMFLWCVIQHGFSHNKRAKVWKVSDGTCPRCGLHQEMIKHLFFTYSIARTRWTELRYLIRGTMLEDVFQSSLFAMGQKPFSTTRSDQATWFSSMRFVELSGVNGLRWSSLKLTRRCLVGWFSRILNANFWP